MKVLFSALAAVAIVTGSVAHAEELAEKTIIDVFGDRSTSMRDDPTNVRPKTITKGTLECLELIALEEPPSFLDFTIEEREFLALECEAEITDMIEAAGYSDELSIDDFRSETIYDQVFMQARIQEKSLNSWKTALRRSEERRRLALRTQEVARLVDAFNAEIAPLRSNCRSAVQLLNRLKDKDPTHLEVTRGIPKICENEIPYQAEEAILAALTAVLIEMTQSTKVFEMSDIPGSPDINMQVIRNAAARTAARVDDLKTVLEEL